MDGQGCGACRFWVAVDYVPPLRDGEWGRCRRFPPHLLDLTYPALAGAAAPNGMAAPPLTSKDQWCGEYAPAKPEAVEDGAATMARQVLLGDLTAARALADKLKD